MACKSSPSYLKKWLKNEIVSFIKWSRLRGGSNQDFWVQSQVSNPHIKKLMFHFVHFSPFSSIFGPIWLRCLDYLVRCLPSRPNHLRNILTEKLVKIGQNAKISGPTRAQNNWPSPTQARKKVAPPSQVMNYVVLDQHTDILVSWFYSKHLVWQKIFLGGFFIYSMPQRKIMTFSFFLLGNRVWLPIL